MPLRDVPIQRKLLTVILLTSAVVFLLTGAGFIAYEVVTIRNGMIRGFTARAQIIAANTSGALVFNDVNDAASVLAPLKIEPQIMGACIYDKDGKVFVTHPSNAPPGAFPADPGPVDPGQSRHNFGRSYLEIVCPIVQGDRKVGTVYLKSDLSALTSRYRAFAWLALLIGAVSIGGGVLVSRSLQKHISHPILALAETARAVSDRRDYSVRAAKQGADEVGLLTDAFNHMLTQIHERDQALNESAARVRAVVNSALSAVVVIDANSRIIDWNTRAEKMFGWTQAEALGRDLPETIIPPQYRERHKSGMKRYLATGEGPVLNRLTELSAMRRDGSEFPVELSISALKTGDVVTFCGFITDITERKRAQAEILQLNATLEQRVQERTGELEAANKELEAFSYSVSHDLRAPLRHIDGFVDILRRETAAGLDESGRRYLGIISDSARRMGTLIDDLLVFSRMGRTEMRRTNVKMDELVAETLREMQHETQGRNIAWDIGPLPEVKGDRAMLKQVWVNLLSNAVKYSRQRERAEIVVRGRKNGVAEWEFMVQDNGAGFDMRYADKLFGVFQRLHQAEEFEGTGIGLANVRRIILRHGGRIWGEGKIDEGATFFFTLPDK